MRARLLKRGVLCSCGEIMNCRKNRTILYLNRFRFQIKYNKRKRSNIFQNMQKISTETVFLEFWIRFCIVFIHITLLSHRKTTARLVLNKRLTSATMSSAEQLSQSLAISTRNMPLVERIEIFKFAKDVLLPFFRDYCTSHPEMACTPENFKDYSADLYRGFVDSNIEIQSIRRRNTGRRRRFYSKKHLERRYKRKNHRNLFVHSQSLE